MKLAILACAALVFGAAPAMAQIITMSCPTGQNCEPCDSPGKCIDGQPLADAPIDSPAALAFLEAGLYSDKEYARARVKNFARAKLRAGKFEDAVVLYSLLDQAGLLTAPGDIYEFTRARQGLGLPQPAAIRFARAMDEGTLPRSAENMWRLSDLYGQARDHEARVKVLRQISPRLDRRSDKIRLAESLAEAKACNAAYDSLQGVFGQDAAAAWYGIGVCFGVSTATLPRRTCFMSAQQAEESPMSRAEDRAVAALAHVPDNSRYFDDAHAWVKFITSQKRHISIGVIIPAAEANVIFACSNGIRLIARRSLLAGS